MRAQGHGVREIARRLGRAPSTISRELRRNAATRGGGLDYRATTAQWHAERAARRPKPAKLAVNAALQHTCRSGWPALVVAPGGAARPRAGRALEGPPARAAAEPALGQGVEPGADRPRLRLDFPGDETMRISHEAIYQALYVQGRGALRRELTACLRTGRALRVPRARSRGRGKSFVAPEIMISERPAEAADRAVPGHWEGDLILGLGSSAIGTLVERTTRFTMLLHLPRMAGHGVRDPREERARARRAWRRGGARRHHAHDHHPAGAAATVADLGPGGGDERSTRSCGSTPACRSTSAIRTARGSAARTRTPTGCCGSTSRKAPT